MLRHFRLLWAAAAVFSECGGELADGAEGLEAGWAEKGGIPSRRRQPGRFHVLRHCRVGSEKGHRLFLREGGRSPAQVDHLTPLRVEQCVTKSPAHGTRG